MGNVAIGLIETQGLAAVIAAADAAVKGADVVVVGCEPIHHGIVTLTVAGEAAAVAEAVESAVRAASAIGRVLRFSVLPGPWEEVVEMVTGSPLRARFPEGPEIVENRCDEVVGSAESDGGDPWSGYTVVELRRLVRALKASGLSGREISKANRRTLVEILRRHGEEREEE
ncbi:hypothetical protein CVV65_12990 [Kyrpidia spormannii]|uniref:BMC domain-containing protein n=1 Tax=Kyrpidia spormannii TaxID=2055160 RepID=A0A2K8N8S3_9BACL|nr:MULTISPECIES: BMC domain-containing protein [Kyrpidia]ATY85728.1 hypothetical protein CVV65_12990 [Kyrpidia spormannii]MCL6575827.1 BMC domain-containing protein [Kyrpidia sp.]CAB3395297.1 conserved protein of unknown function [Kyrpidia spormannii]